MCGIVGIVGKERVAERLLEGLRRLEYRGYDSAGIATICNGAIERRRAEGKLDNLAKRMHNDTPEGIIGIGHTRSLPTIPTIPHIIFSASFLLPGRRDGV